MYPLPNAKVEFFCNGNAVCSIDDEHAVTVPLANFDFHPFVGQEIFLDGHWDIPRLCASEDLFDQQRLNDRESSSTLSFSGCPVRKAAASSKQYS